MNGIYVNSLICFLASLSCLFTAWFIYKNNRQDYVEVSYASFWFFAGASWLFFAASLVLFKIGKIDASLFLNQYIVQTFAFAQVVSVSYFVFQRIINSKKIVSWIFYLYCLFFVIGLYFNYQPGTVYLTVSSNYSFQYAISNTYWIIFQWPFVGMVMATVIDFFKNFYYWFKRGDLFDHKYLFTSFAIIIYAMIGYLEQSGLTATWVSELFRIAIIFCAYIAYFAYKNKEI